MGCDIHMQVERCVNGIWTRIEALPPRRCHWCDGRGHYPERDGVRLECYFCKGTKVQTGPYDARNYTVFSVLANVRNDGYVTPISEARGLPKDATHATGVDEDGRPREEYEYGEHSRSWLTLDEVLAYNWKQAIDDEGFVDADTFAEWDAAGAKGSPKTWSGGVGGGRVKHVSNAEMRRRLRDPYEWEKSDMPYTLIRWTVPLCEYDATFLAFVESLTSLGSPADIRLVFGFDS